MLERINSHIGDTMEQPKIREKVLIGLESAPASFDVRGKVMGPGGANLQYITNETGAIVTVRGRGSGFIEANGQESIEPLHLCVEHSKYEVLQAGRQLAFNLIETVQQEWINLQQQHHQHHHISPIAIQLQQQTAQLLSNGGAGGGGGGGGGDLSGMPVATSLALPVFSHTQPVGQIVNVPPPPLALPPPAIHIPHQQAPLQMGLQQHQQPNLNALIHQGPPPQMQQLQSAQQSASAVAGQQMQQVQVSAGTTTQQPNATPPLSSASATTTTNNTSTTQHANIIHHHQQQQQVYVSQQQVQQATSVMQAQQHQQVQQLAPPLGATTLLPPASIVAAQQPQIVAQASYPLQYMQASSGQMVVAYPNIVRPGGEQQVQQQQQQVMLLQYQQQQHQQVQSAGVRCQQQPRASGATAVLGAATLLQPQIVQIVNPQTGQVQHVLQHLQQAQHQHQHQAPPAATATPTSPAVAPTAALLVPQPPHILAAPHQLQFVQPQQMILAHPPQISSGLGQGQQQPTVGGSTMVAVAQQHITRPPLPPPQSQQHHHQQQQQHGQKRRFEGEQNQFQNLPPQPVPLSTSAITNQQQIRKGIGSSGGGSNNTPTDGGNSSQHHQKQQVGNTGPISGQHPVAVSRDHQVKLGSTNQDDWKEESLQQDLQQQNRDVHNKQDQMKRGRQQGVIGSGNGDNGGKVGADNGNKLAYNTYVSKGQLYSSTGQIAGGVYQMGTQQQQQQGVGHYPPNYPPAPYYQQQPPQYSPTPYNPWMMPPQ